MRYLRWSDHRLRQAAVAALVLLSLAILLASASVVMLRASPADAEGKPVAPDSIAMTARLDRYEYDLENDQTILLTVTGTGTAYLVKDDQTALAGADLRFEIPRLGIAGAMSPGDPGRYAYTLREQVRIHAPVPFLQTRNWRVRDLKIEVDGKDETHRITMNNETASAVNFTRKDLTGAGLAVFTSPRTYSVKNRTRVSFRVIRADGSPAANLSATVELPQRGYKETISTDGEGWVRIDRTDEMLLSIQGGKMVGIQGPVFIEPPADPSTLFWWEDPTPRCDMDFRAQQKRLAMEPGETARFGFEVVNKGNRPDTYTFKVEGAPPEWVELEYEEITLLPFFGQVVYVNVTPERSAGTKVGTRKLKVTAASSCKEMDAYSDAKVTEFHQGDVDIYGSAVSPGPKLTAELRREAGSAPDDRTLAVIIQAGGTLPTGARSDVEGLGGTVTREFSLIHGLAARVPAGKVADLAKLPWVSRVDRNKTVRALLERSVPATGAPELWKLGYDGTGVTVAVIDTGVDYTHPALKGNVLLGPDIVNNDNDPMDGHGHGTHVAGTIASRDQKFRGVAPGSTIMAIKVLSDEGSGTEEGVIAGIEWAVLHGANVINLSLGGPGAGGYDALAQAVDNAVKSGVLVVVAAGNSGPDFSTVGSPGDARLPLTVGATDNDRKLMDWSSRGPTLDGRTKPDVVAPGANIVSSVPGAGWEEMSGTSMATPHVAGIGALLVQASRAEPLLIKDGLKKTALDLKKGPNNTGAGFIQPAAALAQIRQAMVMVQQEVYPGEVAVYDFTLRNQGNVDDRFRLTQWFDDNGLKYRAQSILPASAIRGSAESRIGSGSTTVARAQIQIPADWEGMEDAIYLFHLQSTSLADRNGVDEDRATIKVKATKRSMAEYLQTEVRDLRGDIAAMEMDRGAKADLLSRADAIAAEADRAVDALVASDEARANGALEAARSRAAELDREVQGRQLSAEEKQRLRTRLASIREHLTTAIGTKMRA